MFGKPEWFQVRSEGWGLSPSGWRGRFYIAAWTAVIGVPFLALIWRHSPVQAMVWLAASLCFFLWEVRQIRKASTAPPPVTEDVPVTDDVLVIDETNADKPVRTRAFDLTLKRG